MGNVCRIPRGPYGMQTCSFLINKNILKKCSECDIPGCHQVLSKDTFPGSVERDIQRAFNKDRKLGFPPMIFRN